MNDLKPYDQVFFVHYQCEDFNDGEQIFSLAIHSKGKTKKYSDNEVKNILEYANKVKGLLNEGLFVVHWNQDRPNYGTDHINKRYFDLKGENLGLEYSNEINLAEWLIFKYGGNYISHPRLDNLAKLNDFYGIRETELGQRTFAINRLMLLTKIYFNALNNTLKTALPPQQIKKLKQKPEQETPKTFDELFYNTDLVKPCIDILNQLYPPLIDTDCNYIGKLKGVFCVWIDEMQRQGIVKHYSDRKIFASLIPQKIKRFSIDDSMFGKHQSKAENLYRTDIKTKVSKIKLSQNSQ